MASIPLIFRNFDGGWSTDLKVGIKNSFAFSQSMDFRKSPSQMTVLPRTSREDNGVVKGLIQNEVMDKAGVIWAVDSLGYVYRRSTAGVWSQEYSVGTTGTYGIDYRQDSDQIYITDTISVSVINAVTTAPVFQPQYYGASKSLSDNTSTMGFNVDADQSGSTSTYSLTTSVNEAIGNLRYFQSDIEPLSKIQVWPVSKGTGNWTVTLHDGLNNVLATSTVTNANLLNGQFNDFSFSTPVRIYVSPNARTYHIHVTSTVADGTLSTATAGSMASADLAVFANRLIATNNGIHSIARFLQYECFANSNYLSVWEPITDPPTNAEWQRHRLTFPSEYEACGLAVQNEFLVIALEKTSSSATMRNQDGLLIFWDGTSPTYNYFVKVPEGSPQCVHEYKNVIYYYAGGDWFAIASPTTQPTKVRSMPGSATEYSGTNSVIKVYPHAAAVRRGIHLMAYPSETTNTSINFGVYSYGSIDKNFPESFGYSYLISTGSQNYSSQNNLTIGMVKNFGDTLHISWRDTTSGGYGIDVVDNTSSPAATASWQSLLIDAGAPTKLKTANYMRISYLALPTGATVTPKYSIDRGAWQTGTSFSSTTLYKSFTNVCRLDISPGNFYELQIGFDLVATTQTPTITSVGLWFDPNAGGGGI